MGFMDQLRQLLVKQREEPQHTELIFVVLPEALEPDERHMRYEEPIDGELQLHGLGYVSGGGTQLGPENADGSEDIEFCGVDVDTTDVPAARELLRAYLPAIGCPAGTRLEYRENERSLMDEYDGSRWSTGKPR